VAVTDKNISDITAIEDSQAALRHSIEATKALAERAECAVQRHKAQVERESGDLARMFSPSSERA
jgi:hypothetical protein